MKSQPLRTSVIGSYPFPGWLEFSSQHLEKFGSADIAEMQDDAARVAIDDQLDADLDVITDGEQTRFDFNLSFYGFIEGFGRRVSVSSQYFVLGSKDALDSAHQGTSFTGKVRSNFFVEVGFKQVS